ncbi:centrosomal protein of 290 kDa-like isoform X3 [Bolinopsis microptera]
MMCQEKDNAIQTLQKQINTNAILSRSNEQLQNTVNEQSDRIRDFVYRQMRDTELINELKNDFEAVLKERNDLEGRLQQEKQVHLRRLAALKEQINIARLSFGSIINMLQSEPNIDNEKREALLSQLAEIDAQLGTLQREILDIERMEAENTRIDLDDLTIQFLKKSEQCEALQTQLSGVELDKSRLNKRQSELESTLNDSRSAREDFEEKYEDLRHVLHKKQIEIDTLRAQLNKVKVKLGIIEEDKDTVEAKSRGLKEQNDQLNDDAQELDQGLRETKKKLHQKESLSTMLQKQLEDWENKCNQLSQQISQLQKGLSRSTIQIGILNEEMRVAIRALLDINRNIDSESLEEHLEALQDISNELESLELALEKTMGSQYDLGDMPLRGTSGEKISQLLQELDFCRENMGPKKSGKAHGGMKGAPEQHSAYKRLQHQLECGHQERLHLNSQLSLITEQCRMYKDALFEKERQLGDAESILANVQEQFEPVTGPSKTRHKPIYPLTMSLENMRSIIAERDDLIRTLKSELKRTSAQTKAVISQNVHCNEVMSTDRETIDSLQKLLDGSETQRALLLASYKSMAGERIRQLFEDKCEQTETDYLFEALCATKTDGSDSTDSMTRHKNDADRLKKVVKALKKALDGEVEKRKNASVEFDNLKSDIRKLAIKLQNDGQLHIPTADADIQADVSKRDGMCQTYLPGQTPRDSKKSKTKASSTEMNVQTDEQIESEQSPEKTPSEEEPESETEATPADLGDPVELYRAKRAAQKSMKKLMKENLKLKDALQASVHENQEMREKVKMLLQGDASAIATELEKTLDSNAESRKVISDLLNEKDNLSQKVDGELEPKVSALTEEIERYKMEIALLNQKYATCEYQRKVLQDEKESFKPEPPGSTTDGDVLKENIRLQTKVHNIYQENLKLKSKNRGLKDDQGFGASTTDQVTDKERISTLEEMSEKIENSLSASYNREDVDALKEQVLELQNALTDALDTIKEYEAGMKEVPAAAAAVEQAAPEEEPEEEEDDVSPQDNEHATTQTEVPAGPTRVQLLVKIAIIGTKLTHRTKQIEALEAAIKEKERAFVEKDDVIKAKDEEIAEMDEKVKVKEAELDENRTEIATFQEKMDEFEKTLAAKQKEIEDLVFQAEEEASKTASAGANLEDLAAWKTKYAEVKAQKKKLQGAINFANKTLEEYKVNVDMLTGKVVQYDEDLNAFFVEISDSLKNDPVCCNKNFGYISEKDKLQSAKNVIFKFIEFTTQYSTKQEDLTKDNKTTKDALTVATDKADDLVKKLENTNGDLERTKNILETSQLELSQKNSELNKMKTDYDKVALDFDNLTAEHGALKDDNEKNKDTIGNLEAENNDLKIQVENAGQVIAEKDKTLAEKEQSLAVVEKDIETAKSQLKNLSEAAEKEEQQKEEEEAAAAAAAEEEELPEDEEEVKEGEEGDDASKSLKSVSKSSKKSKAESIKAASIKEQQLSIKEQKGSPQGKIIFAKLGSIEKEVAGINRDILKTKTAIGELENAEEEDADDDEKRKECYESLNNLVDRLAEKNKMLSQLCAENGVKSRPRKSRGGQTEYTIPPKDEVDMPGQLHEPSERHSSTDTLSNVTDITDKSTPVGNLDSRVQELEELLNMKDLEVKELTDRIDSLLAAPSPAPSDHAHDDPQSHDIDYWKERSIKNEGYKKRCSVLEKDLKSSTQEVSNLRKQLIKNKSREQSVREPSVKENLDEQLKNLQKQLEEDRAKQAEIQESIKNCQDEQKMDQEQLNTALQRKIEDKQRAVQDLMAKMSQQKDKLASEGKDRVDIKDEIEKVLGESAQTYVDLQKKFQSQVSQRDEEILKLKSDVRDSNKIKTDAQREIEDKAMAMERLDHKIQLLEQDLNDDSRTYKAFKQEIYELKDIVEDKTKKAKAFETELNALRSTVTKSEDNVDVAIKRMREAELARHEISEKSLENQRKLEEEVKSKEKYVRDAAAKVKAMEAQVESLKNVLVKKHDFEANESKMLELDIDPEIAKTMNNEDLLEKIKKLSEQLMETEKKRIDLKVDFKATLCELEALNSLLEDKERDRDRLVKLTAQLRKEIDRLKAEESSQSIKSEQSQYQFYTDEEYNDLQDELQKMADELRVADDQKKGLQKQRKQEKVQFDRIRAELARRIEEYACLLAVHNKLENSIANLEDQCMQKGLEVEEQRIEILSLKDSLAHAQQSADDIDELYRNKNAEIETLKSEISELANEARTVSNDIERLQKEHETEKAIWSRSLTEMEEDRNNLLKKIESISSTAMAQGNKRNSNVDHAKRFVNILKDLNQDRITSASATQRLEFTAQQNEIVDLRRKLELTDNKRAHLVHELKRCESELQETRDMFGLKSGETKSLVNQLTSFNSKLAKSERKLQDAVSSMKHERQCGELLLEENRHLYADKEKYELNIEELKTNLKYLLTELDVSNSKVNNLSDKLTHCDQLVKNLQKVNKLKTGDNFELVELNAHLIEKLHVHEPVDMISEELNELREQIQPDRGLTEMMYEIEILQNEKEKLGNELNLIKCKESELVKAAESRQELKVTELQNKLSIMQSNNEGTKEFIVNLNSENNELKNQLYDLQYQVEKTEEKLILKEREISKLKSRVDHHKSMMSIPKSPEPDQRNLKKIEDLKNHLSEMQQELKKKEKECKDLHKEMARNEQDYNSALDQAKYYEQLIGELNLEIGKHERDAEDNQKETQKCNKDLQDTKNQLTSLVEENWDLTDRLAETTESNSNKDVINSELKKKCESLENRLSVVTLEHSALMNEMEEVAGELDKVEADSEKRKELDETVKEVLDQNERLAEENARLEAEARGKEVALNNLKRAQSSDAEIKKQLQLMKEENETLQGELREVQGSCKKLSQENNRLSEASSALQMISARVKDLKDNNEQLKKALKKELSRDEVRYLTASFMDRIIRKLNEHIPDEINRLQTILSSKELDIQRLEVEVSSLHSELVEADRVLISHNLKNSPPARVDNRELFEAQKEAAVASRKIKILENQLEDCKISLREVYDENKTLSNILKEAEHVQEELSQLHTPPSNISIGSVHSTPEKESDLKDQVRELQQQLEETHEELGRTKNYLSQSRQDPDGKFICARCKNLISSLYNLNEGELQEMLDKKDRDIVDTEQEIEA